MGVTEQSPLRPAEEDALKQRARRRRPTNVAEASNETELGSLPAGEMPSEGAVADSAGGSSPRRRSTAAAAEVDEKTDTGGKPNKRPSLISRMRRSTGDSAAPDVAGGEAAASAAGTPEQPLDREAPPPPTSELTARPSPIFTPLSKRVKVEAAIYTTARQRPFSLRHRSIPSSLAVKPLDDGLYVAPKAAASARALAVLEKRLGFSPPSKALADEAGALLRQPDPVRHVRVRPSWLDAVNAAAEQLFELERRRPQRWGMTAGHLVAGGGGGAPHVLQVSVGAMQLHDHPLFLRENALQCALRRLANQLTDTHERQQTQLYALKISELIATTAHLREQMVARDDGGTSALTVDARKLQQRLSALTVELLEARQLKDEQECAERLLARRLLRLWRALKREREKQNFRATCARMQFQLIEANPDEEAAGMAADLEDEVEERKLIHALAALAAEAAGVPVAGEFDEEATREQIGMRQSELRRPAEEEYMVPVYTEGTTPTPLERLPQGERKRQQAAARDVFYALLLVDGRVACRMGKAAIDPHEFSVRFDASVQLQLLARPASLALQVWQRRMGGVADRMLSEIFLAVPQTASPVMPQWQNYSFANSRSFNPLPQRGSDSEAIGAALGAARGALEGVSAVTRHALCGAVEVSTAWTTRPADRLQPDGSAGGHSSAQELAQAAAALDPQQVWSMIMPEELDPNAPQDVPLLSLLSRTDRGSVAGLFRAMRNQASLRWSSTWASSDRLSLFAMRRKQPGKWAQLPDGQKAVPSKDALIPGAMRELLRPAADFDSAIDGYDQDRVAQEKAGKVKAWIAQVRARHEAAKASQRYVMDSHDYVREPMLEIEAFELNCDAVMRLMEPRRKLLPNRRARRAVPGSDETQRKIEVVVQSGVDLPVRAPISGGAGGAAGSKPKTRLFVEVRFQGQTFVTDDKPGANPVWNSILELGMKAPGGDWSQKSIMNLSDEISFSLYDRIARAERDERDSAQVTTRQECRWLGGFSLPFSTLYRNGKLEGSFPLSTMPPVLLGYGKDSESSSQALVPSSALKLFITINPLLPLPKDEERERLTQRDAKMQEFAKGWIKAAKRDDRYLRAFAPGADGERTFICRYVRPQNPPDTLRGSASQMLRFVSQIPFLDDAAFDGGSLDVWNTCDSFLELGAGDQEEHALLLCNYLLAIGKEAYVVLGSGIPEGLTSYVLSLDGIDTVLYNACTGRSWTREALERCPLVSVGCVFNDKNIWANVGLSAVPKQMSWNLSDDKHWRPFFGKAGFPAPATLQSTQKATLSYSRTTDSFRSEIEREVFDALQRDVEEQRRFRPTDWNRSANAKLKELLKRFEEDAAGVKPLSAGEHDAALERIRATYRMVGLPINMPYTDRSAIIRRVRETNVFMASAPKIQFALAVYVHAYPNKVCSVWVYAASLEDLRTGARG
jgi:coiled-coil and C2 domain-containing protein 2A